MSEVLTRDDGWLEQQCDGAGAYDTLAQFEQVASRLTRTYVYMSGGEWRFGLGGNVMHLEMELIRDRSQENITIDCD